MKPRQLANVLIKILGLSLCAHGIPHFWALRPAASIC